MDAEWTELEARLNSLSPRNRRIAIKTIQALIDAFLEEQEREQATTDDDIENTLDRIRDAE